MNMYVMLNKVLLYGIGVDYEGFLNHKGLWYLNYRKVMFLEFELFDNNLLHNKGIPPLE